MLIENHLFSLSVSIIKIASGYYETHCNHRNCVLWMQKVKNKLWMHSLEFLLTSFWIICRILHIHYITLYVLHNSQSCAKCEKKTTFRIIVDVAFWISFSLSQFTLVCNGSCECRKIELKFYNFPIFDLMQFCIKFHRFKSSIE